MKLEIRQAKPEEMDDLNKVVETALLLPLFEDLTPELTLCAFENGKLVTSYAAWLLAMRLNGQDIPVSGVTVVGTLPASRRRGYLRQITTRHFESLHEEGERPVAALLASRAAIYRRYGYSTVTTNYSYTVEPRYIQFTTGKPAGGTLREADDDDLELFTGLYNRFIEDRTGYLRRDDAMWKRRMTAPTQEGSKLIRVIYEEDGEPKGYVIYTASQIREGRNKFSQNLYISDLVWLTPTAYRAIWDFFTNMDVIIDIHWGGIPADDPLPHLLLEPRMLNIRTTHEGLLARIVDIEGALNKRGYDSEGELIFKVTDDLCRWNQGVWKLKASLDGSEIRRTEESPQLEIPISTLVMLFFGRISATEAARMGRLDLLKPDCLPIWDKVMKTRYSPACNDGF